MGARRVYQLYREMLLGEIVSLVRSRREVPLLDVVRMTGYGYAYVKYTLVKELQRREACVRLESRSDGEFLRWAC